MKTDGIRSIVRAAEQGDRVGFAALARRCGLAEAQRAVRENAVVRMADRVVGGGGTAPLPRAELRADGASSEPTLFGHFAVFNEWTEIDSLWEGHFLERIAPGAFKKTFKENRDYMRVLFQHGFDPQVGDKPLGPITKLSEDERGGYYESQLLNADYVRNEIQPGLEAGLYGASFRFRMIREEFNEEPGASEWNPAGIPERTLKELRVFEFGPVTFPAYPSATASVRSARMDSEDLGCLAQMAALGVQYIEEQDDPGDEANIPVMEGILASLTDLMGYEAQEDESDEDEYNSEEKSGENHSGTAPSTPDAALAGAPRAESAAGSRRFRSDEDWLIWLKMGQGR